MKVIHANFLGKSVGGVLEGSEWHTQDTGVTRETETERLEFFVILCRELRSTKLSV